jgi:hypothetical protein
MPPISHENGFLYGPGVFGFRMAKADSCEHAAPSTGSTEMIPYKAPPPPVVLDIDGKPVEIVLVDGTIYDVDAVLVQGDQPAEAKLLGETPIAGMLPAPSDMEDHEAIPSVRYLLFTGVTEHVYAGGQLSTLRSSKRSSVRTPKL